MELGPTNAPAASAGEEGGSGSLLYQSSGPAETEAIGAALAQRLGGGEIAFLCGPIGVGKTTFARGVAQGLGVEGAVTSPSFTIGQRYRGRKADLAHLDLYRLGLAAGEEPGLLDDYLDGHTVVVVEWPEESGAAMIGRPRLTVRLIDLGGERRRLEVEFH